MPPVPPVDEDDADTTAAQNAPVVGIVGIRAATAEPHEADADDSTIQELPGAPPANTPTSTRTPVAGPGTAGASPRATGRRPMMTLLGTGPARSGPDDDDELESVTGKPRLAVHLPASILASVVGDAALAAPSTQGDDEELDETQVQTLVATAASAAAGRKAPPPAVAAGDEEEEADSVTTRGPAPLTPRTAAASPSAAKAKAQTRGPALPARAPSPTLLDPSQEPETPLHTERPTSPGTTAPVRGRLPESVPGAPGAPAGSEPYDDESVTSRAPVVPEDDADSVTSRAPRIDPVRASAPRAKPLPAKPAPPAVPAPPAPELATGDVLDDEPPENKTAVMAARPYGAASVSVAAAPVATPSTPWFPPGEMVSESALHVGGPVAPVGHVEHASVGVLALNDPRALAQTAFDPRLAGVRPSEPPRAPRYGMLVTGAALVAVLVPIAVFFLLRGSAEVPNTQEPTARTSDVVKLGAAPRTKAPRPSSSGARRR